MREPRDRTAGIRRRDPEVLDAVVRESLPGLVRAARAAGLDPDQADDAVQAAFLVFFRRAHEFDGRSRVTTWLYGILIRTVAERRRAQARATSLDSLDEGFEARFEPTGRWASPPQPLALLARSEFRRHLADCLGGVPDRQRLAFHLREVDGLSTEEVCKVLEILPNNLGVLLHRARTRLRECLERKGFRGSADADV